MQTTNFPVTFLWTRPVDRVGLMTAMKDEGLSLNSFYPSFLNWCARVVERISNPAFIGVTEDEKHCLSILQQEPISSMALLEIMRRYGDASDSLGHLQLSGLVDARVTHHSELSPHTTVTSKDKL